MERDIFRPIKNVFLVTTAASIVGGCSGRIEDQKNPEAPTQTVLAQVTTPTNELKPTLTISPTYESRVATPTAFPTAQPTPFLSPTMEPKQVNPSLKEAKDNEIVGVRDALIGTIVRIPWEGGSAVVATLDTRTDPNKTKVEAVVLSADCVFDALEKNNKLGGPSKGAWKPNEPVDLLEAKVTTPYSVAVPKPIIEAIRIVYKGEKFDCHEEKALERLKEAVGKIDWDNIPENFGEAIGRIFQGIREGIQRGLATRTPTPVKKP